MASRVIVMAGAPCSGKGTQAKKLAREIGAIHLSIGDVFRDAAAKGENVAQAYMASGAFLPDDLAIAVVRDRLRQPDVVGKGIVLDGFPRTVSQAKEARTHAHTHNHARTPYTRNPAMQHFNAHVP